MDANCSIRLFEADAEALLPIQESVDGTAKFESLSVTTAPTAGPQRDAVFIPGNSGARTCVGIQTLRDPVGIPETEIRNKQYWVWNGTNVTAASTTVYAVGGKTGWQGSATADYYGQYVPAPALQAFGLADFHWWFGSYRHTHEANTIVYGYGACDAEFFFYGTAPGNDSYLTYDVHLE